MGVNINAALGMTSERPLQVGDWVELSSGCNRHRTKPRWVKQVTEIDGGGDAWIGDWCFSQHELRRIDPPRDEVAELREQLAESERWRKNYEEASNLMGQNVLDLMKWKNEAHQQRDAEALRADQAESEAASLREQLATVRAEAAAMREALQVGFMTGESNSPEFGRHRVVIAFRDIHAMQRCHSALIDARRNTAGRELLDEMKRKDGKIKQLEDDWKFISTEYVKESNESERMRRKARTAKLAYAGTLRGKIDESWFGEQSPVWRYRGHVHGALWRTCDGKMIEYGGKGLGIWGKSAVYRDWSDLLLINSTATYPCDEHGKRLEENPALRNLTGGVIRDGTALYVSNDNTALKAIEQANQRIADLERQLADVKRDAELCRELRAWIKNGVFSVVGYSVVIGCQCIPTELAELLISIRDGGAK